MAARGRASTWALIAVAVAFTAIGAWFAQREESKKEDALEVPATAAEEPGAEPALDVLAANASREAAPGAPEAAAAKPDTAQPPKKTAAEPRSFRIHGRIVDTHGAPLAGVGVGTQANPKEKLATSAFDGAFDLSIEVSFARIRAVSDEWSTVYAGMFQAESPERELLVVAARKIALAGRVVDPQGRGIPKANVAIDVDARTFGSFPYPLHTANPEAFGARTADDGTFSMADACTFDHGQLVTSAAGFADDGRALPASSTTDLVIELAKKSEGESVIEGVVVHADGSAAVGAHVHLGTESKDVDDHGHFRLPIPSWVEADLPLVATKDGFQAAVLEGFDRIVAASDRHPAAVKLVLGPGALTIAGYVLDAEMKPLADWSVSLLDPTLLTQSSVPLQSAERETLGDRPQAKTSAEGAFEIGGLRDRAYRLQAFDHRTLVKIESAPIAAGSKDALLVVPADAIVKKISGRVIARDGQPIAHVSVTLQMVSERSKTGWSSATGPSSQTADDGSWSLENVPRRSAYLGVGGDTTIPTQVELDDCDLAQPIVITVMRRSHFRVEGGPKGPASIAALAADGRELQLMTIQNGGWSSSNRDYLVDGASHALAVSEEASKIVLYDNAGKELARRDVHFTTADVTVVKF